MSTILAWMLGASSVYTYLYARFYKEAKAFYDKAKLRQQKDLEEIQDLNRQLQAAIDTAAEEKNLRESETRRANDLQIQNAMLRGDIQTLKENFL